MTNNFCFTPTGSRMLAQMIATEVAECQQMRASQGSFAFGHLGGYQIQINVTNDEDDMLDSQFIGLQELRKGRAGIVTAEGALAMVARVRELMQSSSDESLAHVLDPLLAWIEPQLQPLTPPTIKEVNVEEEEEEEDELFVDDSSRLNAMLNRPRTDLVNTVLANNESMLGNPKASSHMRGQLLEMEDVDLCEVANALGLDEDIVEDTMAHINSELPARAIAHYYTDEEIKLAVKVAGVIFTDDGMSEEGGVTATTHGRTGAAPDDSEWGTLQQDIEQDDLDELHAEEESDILATVLNNMEVEELVAIAVKIGEPVSKDANKDDIISALTAHYMPSHIRLVAAELGFPDFKRADEGGE